MGLGPISGRIAVVGTGVIGASWTAYFLAKGFDVAATDPADGAEKRLRTLVDGFWPALEHIGLHRNRGEGGRHFAGQQTRRGTAFGLVVLSPGRRSSECSIHRTNTFYQTHSVSDVFGPH
jgi:hypothetical protein